MSVYYPDRISLQVHVRDHGASEHSPIFLRMGGVLRTLATTAFADLNNANPAFKECEEAYVLAQLGLVTNRNVMLVNSANSSVEIGRYSTVFRVGDLDDLNWQPLYKFPKHIVGHGALPSVIDDQCDGMVDFVFPIENLIVAPVDEVEAANCGLIPLDRTVARLDRKYPSNQLVSVGEQNMLIDLRNGGFGVIMPARPTLNDLLHTCFNPSVANLRLVETEGVIPVHDKTPDEEKASRDARKTDADGLVKEKIMTEEEKAQFLRNSSERTSCDGSCLGDSFHACHGRVCSVAPLENIEGAALHAGSSKYSDERTKCTHRPRYSGRLLHGWAEKYIEVVTQYNTTMENHTDEARAEYNAKFTDWMDGVWCRFWRLRSGMLVRPNKNYNGTVWSFDIDGHRDSALGRNGTDVSPAHAASVENHFFVDTTRVVQSLSQTSKTSEEDPSSVTTAIPVIRRADVAMTPEGNVLLCNMRDALQNCLSPADDATVTYNYLRWKCCWRGEAAGGETGGLHAAVTKHVTHLVGRLKEYKERITNYSEALKPILGEASVTKLLAETGHYISNLNSALESANTLRAAMSENPDADGLTEDKLIVEEMSETLFNLDTVLRFTIDQSTYDPDERLARTSDVMDRHNRKEDALETYLVRRVVRYLEFGLDSEQLRNLREIMAMPQHRGEEECAASCPNYRNGEFAACFECKPLTSHENFEDEMDYVYRLFALSDALGADIQYLSVMKKYFEPTEAEAEAGASENLAKEEDASEDLPEDVPEEKTVEVKKPELTPAQKAMAKRVNEKMLLVARKLHTKLLSAKTVNVSQQELSELREIEALERIELQAQEALDEGNVRPNIPEIPLTKEEAAKKEFISVNFNAARVVILFEEWKKRTASPLYWTTTTSDNFWLMLSETKDQLSKRTVLSQIANTTASGNIYLSRAIECPWVPADFKQAFVQVFPVEYVSNVNKHMVRKLTEVFRRAQPGFRATNEEYVAWKKARLEEKAEGSNEKLAQKIAAILSAN